jgi:AAHS family 4-hydroxybenzoate transporter-like MFS transporter
VAQNPHHNESRRVDVGEFINAMPFRSVHVILTTLCAAVALLDGFDTLAISYAAPAIAEQWHSDASLFGPIFASHLIGGAIGGALIGTFADLRGRRIALVAATVLFGLSALATALSTNFTQLFICRLLTGAGLAGALVNAISLASEYAPQRIRASVVSAMFCAFPLGGAIAGIVSVKMIAAWGWPSVFWVGGALPIALSCLLTIALPESVRFLVATGSDRSIIADVLNRLALQRVFRGNEAFALAEEAATCGSVWEIFSAPYRLKTILLWITFAINQIALTFSIAWMPLVLHHAGSPLGRAITASAVYTLAGVLGAIVIAKLADHAKSGRPVAWAYLLSALAMGAIGYAASTVWLLFVAVSLAGLLIVGVAVNLNPIAASVYPTAIRSAGVGWGLTMKSAGGIAGALLGSVLVSTHLRVEMLYLIATFPIVIGAASLAWLVTPRIAAIQSTGRAF